PYLRHITLWSLEFEDALELQTLLEDSTSLKTLVLRSVMFGNTEPPEPIEQPSPPQVVLDSLQLYFLDAAQLQALLDSFTSIDITRLRSLYLHNTPMNSLVRVNAPTIQRINIRAYYPDMFLNRAIDPEALADAHDLEELDLNMPFLTSLNRVLRMFGSLVHLTRLRTISVTVSQTSEGEWQALDGLLGAEGDLPALEKVNIYLVDENPHPGPLLRKWMPALTGRGVLHIHNFSLEFSLQH
ncbi:hypothetical protein B0H19DRAFT_1290995, partial [Mycena capillaripes]